MFKNISDSIKYIGVNDITIDLFENQYKVPNGISYNSYFIFDDKNALLDTVDDRMQKEWINNLNEALDSKGTHKIDYLVISHVESDHSGSIPKILELYPDIKVVGNAQIFMMIEQFYKLNLSDERKLVIKDGDTLDLGTHKLHFIHTPMVHWPEVQMSYEESEKILFSADAFGKFGQMGADESWTDEARRYYINIVGKYGPQVQAALAKVSKFDIKMICPLHGEILSEDLGRYIDLYSKWSTYTPETSGTLIVYGSLHDHTKMAAIKLSEIIKDKLNSLNINEDVKLYDISRSDVSEVIAQCFKYNKIVFASSSYNMGIFPMMEFLLRQLTSKNFQNRDIGIIENGTWAPSAKRTIIEIFKNLPNIRYIEPSITIKSSMNEQNIQDMSTLADEIIKLK